MLREGSGVGADTGAGVGANGGVDGSSLASRGTSELTSGGVISGVFSGMASGVDVMTGLGLAGPQLIMLLANVMRATIRQEQINDSADLENSRFMMHIV